MSGCPRAAYSPEARERIYEVLGEKSRAVLATGHSVIVDAVYADATSVRPSRRSQERRRALPRYWLQAADQAKNSLASWSRASAS